MNARSLSITAFVTVVVIAFGVMQASPSLIYSEASSAGIATPLAYEEHKTSPEFILALNQLQSHLERQITPDPFIFDGELFEFDWCRPNGRRNKSLKDLGTRLERDSARARDLAQLYAITGASDAYNESLLFLVSWTNSATLFNAYEQGADASSAKFPGIESGFCNRSWNMMLDSIWQTYGLINFSEAYSILANSDLAESHKHQLNAVRNWLKHKLIPAVNASFHTWTKFADAHPTSGAYIRYRSDNHLSWCLAGLATAGFVLNDKALLDYVYYGSEYDDGISGPYENPSALLKLIPFAIKPSGEVYDEAIRSEQHKGFFYGNFSLWALVITAINTERAGYPPVWETQLTTNSGTLSAALDRYAPYVSKELPLPDSEEVTEPEFFSFVYRLILPMDWITGERKQRYLQAANAATSQKIRQGLGSIDLITATPKEISNY